MSVQQGRIGGPLLADNLLRNGANLAFENKVLYLDVVNKRIGFNNAAPVNDLYTPNAIDSVNLIVDTTADIGNFVVSGSTIQQVLTTVTIAPSALAGTAYISTPGLSTSNLYAYGNTLSDTVLNDSINITPNGTGSINFTNGNGSVQVTVNGGLHATGNITWDGNVTLGDQVTDLITFSADVNSNILPSTNNTYTLGTAPGSLYFSTTTTSYLAISGGGVPGVGTGVFTAELWFYLTQDPAVNINRFFSAVSGGGFSLYTGSSYITASATGIVVDISGQNSITFTVPTMVINTWYHVAVTRDASGYMSLWLNGTRSSTGRITNTFNFTGTTGSIGIFYGYYAPGTYMSNLRLTNTAVYDTTLSSITVPTSPLTAIAGTQLLLATPYNSNYLKDTSTNAFTFTATGSVTSSVAFPPTLGNVWNNLYVTTYSTTTLGSTANTTLNATTFNSSNIALTTNTIANSAGNDISFTTSGTGAVNFNGSYYFNTANTITFPSAVITIGNTGNGYMQFTGNNGVVFPAGTSSNYPPTPVQGQIRYNSTLGYSEVYNGTSWNPVGGTSAVLTQNQVNDVMWAWDLILG